MLAAVTDQWGNDLAVKKLSEESANYDHTREVACLVVCPSPFLLAASHIDHHIVTLSFFEVWPIVACDRFTRRNGHRCLHAGR
jgi:hypothetical protein